MNGTSMKFMHFRKNPDRNRPFGKPRNRWKYRNQIDFKGIGIRKLT
jgi:hypothetical protein